MNKRVVAMGILAGLLLSALQPGEAWAAKKRRTGAVLLPPAQFKALPSVPRYRAYLPPSADLTPWFPAPGEQGDQPSCTAWATGYALRSYYENRLSKAPKATPAALSPAFIYNQLIEPGQSCSQGLAVPTALDLLKQSGVPPMTAFSYDEKTCDRRPTSDVIAMAGHFRIEDWKAVNPRRLDDVKGEIANGNPVVIAMQVTKDFEKYESAAPFDDLTPADNTHAMVLVGYDESKRSFRLINSWGEDWGDKGYGWLTYRAFDALVPEAYTVRLDEEVPPAPLAGLDPEPPKPVPAKQEPVTAEPVKAEPEKTLMVKADPVKPEPDKSKLGIKEASVSLSQLSKQFRCSVLESNAESDVLEVKGFVATEADRDRVESLLGDGGPGWKPRYSFKVEPWPLCEARQTLAVPLTEPRGLSINLRNDDAGKALKSGQKVVLEVTTPDFPSYLYVSYLQVDGQVVHLHRYGNAGGKPLPAGKRVVLGEGGELRISGPRYGNEVVIAIASPLPLLALDRKANETERDYLTEFRQAILTQQASKGKAAVVASMLRLTTKP